LQEDVIQCRPDLTRKRREQELTDEKVESRIYGRRVESHE